MKPSVLKELLPKGVPPEGLATQVIKPKLVAARNTVDEKEVEDTTPILLLVLRSPGSVARTP